MGNDKSSPLKEILASRDLGDLYDALKNDEDDLKSLIEANDKEGVIETLYDEFKKRNVKKSKARIVANDLFEKAANNKNNKVNKQNKNVYLNQQTEHEHTTLYGSNNNGCSHQHQQFKQKQERINIQQEVIVRGQVLLDATKDQITVIDKYLKAFSKNEYGKDDENVSNLNDSALTGLRLFRANCKILRKKQKQNKKMDFSSAFSAAEVPVNDYEENIIKLVENMSNKEEIMQRLSPLLDYMRCSLRGRKAPKLPETNDFIHNKYVARDALGQALKGMNHTIPDRVNQIKQNTAKYEQEQRSMYARSQQPGFKKETVQIPNVRDLHQDINKPLYPPQNKQSMEAILAQDTKHYAFDPDHAMKEVMGHNDDDDESESSSVGLQRSDNDDDTNDNHTKKTPYNQYSNDVNMTM